MFTPQQVTFASFISYLTDKIDQGTLDERTIKHIAEYIDRLTPPVEVARTSVTQLDILLSAMATNRKIEAIKEYRSLTGSALKDAKDAVERYSTHPKVNYAPRDANNSDWPFDTNGH